MMIDNKSYDEEMDELRKTILLMQDTLHYTVELELYIIKIRR